MHAQTMSELRRLSSSGRDRIRSDSLPSKAEDQCLQAASQPTLSSLLACVALNTAKTSSSLGRFLVVKMARAHPLANLFTRP
ncbi:hypothetical protein D3C85_753900 [compost metagenome]